jgi:hypothetical protein
VNTTAFSVRGTFLELTSQTTPYGHEARYWHLLEDLGGKMDKAGNVWIRVGKSRTMFTAHLDTADFKPSKVTHVLSGDIVKTDGKTLLGADCKAGVTVLLGMIAAKVPGVYAFFVGEECGRIGSIKAANRIKAGLYDRCISFDRRGTSSIISHQMSERGCSAGFISALSDALAYHGDLTLKADSTGSFTDSYSFFDTIPECTNISVGYSAEHTVKESQNLAYLEQLLAACISTDWEALPTIQHPLEREYLSAAKSWGSWREWEEEDKDEVLLQASEAELEHHLARYGSSWESIQEFVKSNPIAATDLLYMYFGGG